MIQLHNLMGRELGQYTLKQLVGKGGMSAVYRAHQPSLNRDVAVKVMSPSLATDPSYIQRFKLEAKTAASLEHNNIVPVYDYGTDTSADGEISYIVMRLLTGGTLGERLQTRVRAGGPLPSGGEAVTLLNEMAKALGYAHSRGVVHRDIKANNIMFDSEGDPYIVDFGIARAVQSNLSLTAENLTIGTPPYMAPEQWRDEDLTPAVDQYALGVLLYYVLTGRLPFRGSTSAALMQQHLNDTPPLASEERPAVPARAAQVVARALAKDPTERFANVRAFAADFEAAMREATGQPTDFFRFRLRSLEQTTPGEVAPSPAPPAPAVRPEDMAPPPAARTVRAPAAPTVPNEAAPPPAANVPPPGPAAPPPAHVAPRRRNPGLIAGLGALALLAVGGFTLLLLGVFGPATPAGTPTPTLDLTSAPAPTVPQGGIRINPTPGANPTTASNGDAVPTAITVVGPGAGAIVVSGGDVLYSQLEIVIRAVAVSSGGVVASGHADGRIRLWTDGTGAAPKVLQQHSGVVNDLAFSADGTVLVSAGDDRTVRVWDAANATYRGVLAGHTGAVRGVDISPDGQTAASASEDGSVRLWDVNAGRLQTTLVSGNIRLYTVAFSPDGTLLAAGDNAGSVILFDVASGRRVRTLTGHESSVRSVAFSGDGARLASGGTDDTVRVWEVASGSPVATLRGHNNDVWRVRMNSDGTQVASGGRDNNLRLWDANNGNLLQTYTGHGGWVLGVAYSPDESLLFTGGGDGALRVWDAIN